MKKYVVVVSKTNSEKVDLVNVEDDSDTIPAAPDEFTEGDIITEEDFYLEKNSYVDDETYGNMLFAFPKK
jgi:hypothetical protein